MGVIIAILIGDGRFFNSPDLSYVPISEDIASLIYNIVFVVIFTASKYKGTPGKLVCKIQVLDKDMTKKIGRAHV